MSYLLDICVISDFIKGEAGTTARLKQTPPADIAISAITVMELRYGLAINPQRAQKVEPAIAISEAVKCGLMKPLSSEANI
jgi:tRNA(fMet)-specific endonuclease VapC